MIGTIYIKCNAAHPNLALPSMFTFINSPQSIRVIDVPKKIGTWNITDVFVNVNYPDNTLHSEKCVKVGCAYVATIPAPTQTGKSLNGYSITANGIDENGEEVNGYVLGKGDVHVMEADGEITVGETTYYLHILDEMPETPKKGDVYQDDSVLKIYDGERWISCVTDFDPSDYYTKTETDTKLATKQNKLSNNQIASINIDVDRSSTFAHVQGQYTSDFIVFGSLKYSNITSDRTKILELRVGNGVTDIDSLGFQNCTALTSVAIPGTTKVINSDAFYGCSNLSYVKLGDGVEYINRTAFSNCPILTEVEIPRSIIELDSLAFANSPTTLIFRDSSLEEVQAMSGYPWGRTTQQIKTANYTTKEYVAENYKAKQTAKASPTASGNSTSFIDTISQNEDGVITATKKTIPNATTSRAGIVQLNNTLTSTLSTQAATASTVKTLNDKFASYLPLSGGTITSDTGLIISAQTPQCGTVQIWPYWSSGQLPAIELATFDSKRTIFDYNGIEMEKHTGQSDYRFLEFPYVDGTLAVTSNLRYAIGSTRTITNSDVQTDTDNKRYAEVTLVDRTLNSIEIFANLNKLKIVVPTIEFENQVQDFAVKVNNTNGANDLAIEFADSTVTAMTTDGNMPTVPANTFAIIWFTLIGGTKQYMIKGEVLKVAN